MHHCSTEFPTFSHAIYIEIEYILLHHTFPFLVPRFAALYSLYYIDLKAISAVVNEVAS